MKNLKKCIVPVMVSMTCVLFPSFSLADTLKKPSWSEVLKNPENDAAKLKKLLDAGNLTGFYDEAERILDKSYEKEKQRIKNSEPEIASEQEMKDYLSVCYLIASAPFVDMEPYENVRWARRGKVTNPDYCVKDRLLLHVSHESILMPDSEKKFKFKKQEALELYLSNYASILKQFREQIDPHIDEKQEKEKEAALKDSELMNDQDASARFFNRLNNKSNRSRTAQSTVEVREKSFLKMLVESFPGKAAEVKKYIKIAGYTDEEIPGLIDRTVGRDAETEFLYKGRKEQKPPRKK